MSIFLIIIGILGILVSLFNLYSGARYIATQMSFRGEAGVMPNTVWQLNTLPALSTILLFVLKHWIFAIAIFLPAIQMLLTMLGSRQRDEVPLPFLTIFPQVSGFLGRILIVFGAAIILTLSLTNQNTNSPTLLSWYFPILIVVSFFVTWVANRIFGWLIGIFASMMSRDGA